MLPLLFLKHDLIAWAANNGLKIQVLTDERFVASDDQVEINTELSHLIDQMNQGHELIDILANETN